MNWIQLLKKTSPYLIMVVIAFILMGVTGYYSANDVMREHLLNNSQSALRTVEENIVESLARADMMLLSPYHFIRDLLDRGGDLGVIDAYLKSTTHWMRRDHNGTPGFYGVYAYIEGEFVDGIGLNPPPGYDPAATKWFKVSETLEDGELAYTDPYVDPRTGGMIISAVRNLYSLSGNYYGVLVLDIDLSWFKNQYIQPLSFSTDGYGFIVNQDFRVIAHPNEEFLGRPLREINHDYLEITEYLLQSSSIRNRRLTDVDGKSALIYMNRIFNGWYVAIVTPMETYYHNIYDIQINPTFMGLILILLFSLIMLRINASSIHSDEISAYKSTFLAQMSHEIRTPMNAVIGMSELALREPDQNKVLEYLGGIKQAGHNLLSIINDILDISRIEAGALQITPISYYFASLLNDVISMIRVQIAEKPVIFLANMEAGLPNALVGDESRVKQVLINLLSNAAKYTQEGYIALEIRGTPKEGKGIFFTIEVSDSGVGIKKEDIPMIFDNFVRLDMEKNRGVEGTGLGLVITRNLCRAMGGDVTVSSEYGKGSVFTATLLQQFDEDEGLASVENPSGKRVLLYEARESYAASILKSLEDLKVPAKHCNQKNEFFRELEHGGYVFAFVTADIVEEAMERIKTRFLPTNLVLLSNPGELFSFQNIPMLIMPAYVVPIANVLNHRTIFEQRKQRSIHFIAPSARILVVDDIATNVKVAEGLLTLYQPIIDTCYDGKTSVEMVRKHHYDIVFMDHMMPGMDGIEAASAIRNLGTPPEIRRIAEPPVRDSPLDGDRFKNLPIIALTANAVFGMREMFLASGFNDYLAKPIEIAKLDEIMARWIPMDKRVGKGSLDPSYAGGNMPVYKTGVSNPLSSQASGKGEDPGIVPVEGIDVRSGMENTGSFSWLNYCDVLSLFCQDASSRLELLRGVPGEGELVSFVTQIHAIKGASSSIGAGGIAKQAAALEEAGKTGDISFIRHELGVFHAELESLVARINAVLGR